MAKYKLDFRNKNHLEQLALFERILTSLDALPPERREDAYLEELRTLDAACRASHTRIASLRTDLKAEISRRKDLFLRAQKAATRAGVGALIKSKWEPAEILAAGLDLAAPRNVRVGTPAAPQNLRGVPTASEGEALLRWQRTVRRCAFEVHWHADPITPDHWQFEDTCCQQKCLIKGLASGAKYWFRVRAVNAHGASPWSQVASVRVK